MMTETTTPETTPAKTATTTAPKIAKSATVTLAANGSMMQIVAERTKDGARTYVITTDTATKKSVRGMTQAHGSFDLARAATEKLAAEAVKRGWHRKEARRGFTPKADAFSSLPAAPVAKAKK